MHWRGCFIKSVCRQHGTPSTEQGFAATDAAWARSNLVTSSCTPEPSAALHLEKAPVQQGHDRPLRAAGKTQRVAAAEPGHRRAQDSSPVRAQVAPGPSLSGLWRRRHSSLSDAIMGQREGRAEGGLRLGCGILRAGPALAPGRGPIAWFPQASANGDLGSLSLATCAAWVYLSQHTHSLSHTTTHTHSSPHTSHLAHTHSPRDLHACTAALGKRPSWRCSLLRAPCWALAGSTKPCSPSLRRAGARRS